MSTHSPPASPAILVVTGGIGSGKSTVARAFAELGVPCIDADLVARRIHQDAAHPAMLEVARRFPAALTPDGRLARGSLRTVFADSAANDELKRILGPWVLDAIVAWACRQASAYVLVESALISARDFPGARVLVIDAPQALRIERIALRNPDWSSQQAAAVIALQPAREAYLALADDIVVNDGPAHDVVHRAAQLHASYLTLWTSP
jgi:dephospho-CoA kinase